MATGAIKYSDLADDGAFEKLIANAEKVTEAIEKMDAKVVQMASSFKSALGGSSPKSLADVENLGKTVKKVDELASAHEKLGTAQKALTIDIAKAKLAQQELNKGVMEAAKNELGLTSEYQKQSKILNELRNKYKDLALTNQQNTTEGKALLKNVTELDTKLKAVDATVGQHQRNVGNYHGAINTLGKGLKGITGILGEVGAAVGLNTEHMEALIHTGKGILKSIKEIKHVVELEKIAHVQNAAAVESEMVAQEQLNAVRAASIGTIALAVVGVAALAAGIYYLMTMEHESEEAVKAFNEANTKLNETLYEQQRILAGLAVDQKVFNKTYTKAQGESLKAELDGIDKKKKANTEYEIAVDKIRTAYDLKSVRNIDVLMEKKGLMNTKIEELTKKHNEELANIDLETKANKMKIEQDALMSQMDEEDKANEKAIERLKHRKEIEKQFLRDIEKYRREYTEFLRRQEHELRVFQKEEADKAVDDAKKAADEELYNAVNANNEQVKANLKQAEVEKKWKEKKAQEAKEARQKEIEQEIALTESMVKQEASRQKQLSDLKLKQIDSDQKSAEENIDVQAQLAARGLDNTLAYEMKRKQELEKARMEEIEKQKKLAQQQEIAELSLAFVKAYQNYISKDMSSAQALGRAATDVLAAKVIGKAVAGSAFDGVEDTGGAGDVDSKGGKLWVLHPHEGVVNKKGNEETKGLVGAVNKEGYKGAVDWAMENIYEPQYNSSMQLQNDRSRKSQVDTALVALMVNQFEDLKKTIANKVENHIELTRIGDVIKSTVENQYKKTTIKKTYLS